MRVVTGRINQASDGAAEVGAGAGDHPGGPAEYDKRAIGHRPRRGVAFGGDGPRPALGYRSLSGLGRPGRLLDFGVGDRLPQPGTARLATP